MVTTNFVQEPKDVDDTDFDEWYVDVIKKSGMMDN